MLGYKWSIGEGNQKYEFEWFIDSSKFKFPKVPSAVSSIENLWHKSN